MGSEMCIRDSLKKHGHINLKEDFRTVLIKLNPKLIPSVANANLANLV